MLFLGQPGVATQRASSTGCLMDPFKRKVIGVLHKSSCQFSSRFVFVAACAQITVCKNYPGASSTLAFIAEISVFSQDILSLLLYLLPLHRISIDPHKHNDRMLCCRIRYNPLEPIS